MNMYVILNTFTSIPGNKLNIKMRDADEKYFNGNVGAEC